MTHPLSTRQFVISTANSILLMTFLNVGYGSIRDLSFNLKI